MSSDLTVYVGPYIECSVRKAEREIQVHACTGKACPRPESTYVPGSAAFCLACGSPIGLVSRMTRDEPDLDAITRGHLHRLGDERAELLLYLGPNRRQPPKRTGGGRYGETHVDVAAIDQAAEIAWFETEHADAIEKVRGAYNDVRVTWGFHTYWM